MIQESTSWYLSKENKTLTQKDIGTHMFTEALFTIAKIWKQPKYPAISEWGKKLVYT